MDVCSGGDGEWQRGGVDEWVLSRGVRERVIGGVEDQAQQGYVCVHQDLLDIPIIPDARVVHMEKYSLSRSTDR